MVVDIVSTLHPSYAGTESHWKGDCRLTSTFPLGLDFHAMAFRQARVVVGFPV